MDINAPEMLRARRLLRDIEWYRPGLANGEALTVERKVAEEIRGGGEPTITKAQARDLFHHGAMLNAGHGIEGLPRNFDEAWTEVTGTKP